VPSDPCSLTFSSRRLPQRVGSASRAIHILDRSS
jgi:hypothetical protein